MPYVSVITVYVIECVMELLGRKTGKCEGVLNKEQIIKLTTVKVPLEPLPPPLSPTITSRDLTATC